VAVVGASIAHPLIDIATLELPEPSNLVRWQTLADDPLVDRVSLDAEVLSDFRD